MTAADIGKRLQHRLETLLEGRYKIKEELGRGGMAIVFLARDLRHERWVAIKLIHPEMATPTLAERFLREIQITAKLQHPHILPLLDSGVEGDLLYYVMPHVEGESLRDRLEEADQLPIDEAITITRHLASALQYAHDNGVVHRDIKPENVLLSNGLAVLADFGIAKTVAETSEGVTVAGFTLGTPAYMSPEQATGGEVDHLADQYSLACVVYEMLGGRPPFLADTVPETIELKLTARPPSVSSLRSDLPGGIDKVLGRALAKDPSERYSKVAKFIDALSEAFPSAGTGESAVAAAPRRQPVSLRSWGVGLLLIGGLLSIAVIILLLLLPAPAKRKRDDKPVRADSATASAAATDDGAVGSIEAKALEFDRADSTASTVATGFAEDLTRRLGRSEATGSAAETTGPGAPATLDGRVERRGGDLGITLRLVSTAGQTVLWTETYVFPADEPAALRAAALSKATAALTARSTPLAP